MRERRRPGSTDRLRSIPRPRPAAPGRRRSTVLVVVLVAGLVGIPGSTAAYDVEREFLATKVPFRHVWSSPLPVTSSGAVDGERLLLEASGASLPDALAHLAPSLDAVGEALRAGDEEAAASLWRSTIAGTRIDGPPLDLNQLIQLVLREAYLENDASLRHHAQKVRYYNEQKQQIRHQIREAERTRSSFPDACDDIPDRCDLVTDVDLWIEELESQLDHLDEDAQLANVDLQASLQKKTQTLQAMSNVARMLHDAAMAVISRWHT